MNPQPPLYACPACGYTANRPFTCSHPDQDHVAVRATVITASTAYDIQAGTPKP